LQLAACEKFLQAAVMSAQYNDYVLETAVQQGWITDEQKNTIEYALQSLPGASALDLMLEQQLLNRDQYEAFQQAILQAEAAAGTTTVTESQAGPEEAHVVGTFGADENITITVSSDNPQTVDDYLALAKKAGASDLQLTVAAPPTIRLNGILTPLPGFEQSLAKQDLEKLVHGFLTPEQHKRLEEKGDLDFCYSKEGLGRFRTSVVKHRLGFAGAFRIINSRVPTMEDLGLPPHLKRLTQYHNGLVLVTGPVGCGKSTTLAALINEINKSRHDHIITLEDPIEYLFTSGGCHVTQREIHNHTESFATALRAALREDPDVIMVGEMRDLETIQLAITASETGHLVLATLHTASAARTLDRILDVFPTDQQDQIRVMVSESLRGIISQQLLPRADGRGRVLAMEILVNSPAVASLIRDAKTFMLPGVIQTGRKLGMQLMDDSIMALLQAKLITPEVAYEVASNRKLFEPYLKN
jgi:twitching motility protein PilT